MRMRATATGGLAAALLLGGAGPAAAAQLDVAVAPANAALGEPHGVSGELRDDAGAALPGRRISLQARAFPFTGAWRTIDHATTDGHGRYAIDDVELDRNADLRAVAFDGTESGIARAFTYPAHRLAYRVLGRRRIRLTQTYRTPRDVRLRKPTLFYVGSAAAVSAPVRARARTERLRRGRFRAIVTVTLPRAYRGRFRYASCFAYTAGSGMGDPAQGCPRRYTF